jgi:predicted Fe-Mo cluster-binding NifX family protein
MKIAIPTRGNFVDNHFGHCEAYTVFTIDENKIITSSEILPSPQGCGCKSNIASVLQQKGVSIMLAGNMGNGALNVLTSHGIEVYRGCTGDIHKVAEGFLKGQIDDSGEGCHHHEQHGEDHQCNH